MTFIQKIVESYKRMKNNILVTLIAIQKKRFLLGEMFQHNKIIGNKISAEE